MEFLNPTALWGLGLIGVPIIIHLITRKKALPKPFAAIRFVLLSHQHLKRRLRLKRILILLARILAVVMLVTLISHPTLPAGGNRMNIGETPRSLVIILDNSMSMLAKTGNGRPWDSARSLAASLLNSIGPGHEAALIVTNPDGKAPAASLTADPRALRHQLEETQPSFVYRPMNDSIAEAAALLESARHELKQILLITDLQRAPWRDGVSPLSTDARFVVFDVGGGVQPANAAVANVELNPSGGEARYDASIEIASSSPEDMPGKEVTILVGERARARGFVDLPARGRVIKKLGFSAEGEGILRGVAHIAPDALNTDNDRFFTARAGGRISALVVDGDPKPERYGAESYYLMNALNPKLDARSRIEPALVTTAGLAKSKLDRYDIVILANVGTLEVGVREKLKRYVSEGGALIISLGDKIDPQGFASWYGDLAPAVLYVLKEPVSPIHIDSTGLEHPVVRMFATPEGGDLSLAAFKKYFLIDPSGVKNGKLRTILRLNDGAPLLVEKSLGRGKIALFTSTLDRDWNDLCIYPTYLPLLQQLALYLTGGMTYPTGSDYAVGAAAHFSCAGGATAALVFGPGNAKRRVELTPRDNTGVGDVTLDDGPGFYEVFCSENGRSFRKPERDPDRLLAANIDVRESDLSKWNPEALENHIRRLGLEKVRLVKNVAELTGEEGFKRGRKDAYRLVFAALIGMLLLESFLTRRG